MYPRTKGLVKSIYSANVLDFFLALATSGDEKAFEFVSGNLCGILLHYMQGINKKKRTNPFININYHEIVT